jgi:hypothetical protein
MLSVVPLVIVVMAVVFVDLLENIPKAFKIKLLKAKL